ncbi:GAF domain-containing protein [Natribacillus halophilus]|uniref:GAF domain-containing protein n=1 Tax=Natribacillus halophilus TaxID=549003 RepID=A0A1G8P2C5_9BACI|nr:GAF domain-containing protein [Natribacillus halophilus]SDI86644.1 GAF domain-containing protein [Natribacillus halophilus]
MAGIETIILEAMDRFPDWIYAIAGVIFIAGGVILIFQVTRISNKFAKAVGREDRIGTLAEKNAQLQTELKSLENIQSQYDSSLNEWSIYLQELKNIKETDDDKFHLSVHLIKKLVNAVPNNMISNSGSNHRCALWMYNSTTETLEFFTGSAQFPNDYKDGGRALDINNTAGGRCFRKSESLFIDDVTEDDDWIPNEDSKSHYNSLICIPILNWGIMTVDSVSPFTSESRDIINVYTDLLTLVIIEMYDGAVQSTSTHRLRWQI